jgi:hypothetical protein
VFALASIQIISEEDKRGKEMGTEMRIKEERTMRRKS